MCVCVRVRASSPVLRAPDASAEPPESRGGSREVSQRRTSPVGGAAQEVSRHQRSHRPPAQVRIVRRRERERRASFHSWSDCIWTECRSVRPFVCPFICRLICPSVNLSICLFICWFICPFTCPFICPLVYPFVCSSVRPSICHFDSACSHQIKSRVMMYLVCPCASLRC